jgi:uncharacterized protein Yka (UPF0111/DUF47 family)
MGESARKDDEERLTSAVDRLEKTVSRFCVLLERMMASNDQASEQARKRVAELHPRAAAIQEEVRRKLQARRGT